MSIAHIYETQYHNDIMDNMYKYDLTEANDKSFFVCLESTTDTN